MPKNKESELRIQSLRKLHQRKIETLKLNEGKLNQETDVYRLTLEIDAWHLRKYAIAKEMQPFSIIFLCFLKDSNNTPSTETFFYLDYDQSIIDAVISGLLFEAAGRFLANCNRVGSAIDMNDDETELLNLYSELLNQYGRGVNDYQKIIIEQFNVLNETPQQIKELKKNICKPYLAAGHYTDNKRLAFSKPYLTFLKCSVATDSARNLCHPGYEYTVIVRAISELLFAAADSFVAVYRQEDAARQQQENYAELYPLYAELLDQYGVAASKKQQMIIANFQLLPRVTQLNDVKPRVVASASFFNKTSTAVNQSFFLADAINPKDIENFRGNALSRTWS